MYMYMYISIPSMAVQEYISEKNCLGRFLAQFQGGTVLLLDLDLPGDLLCATLDSQISCIHVHFTVTS